MANLAVFTYLAILALGYFYPVLSGAALLTERDLAVFFIPPRVLWVNILKGGEFPLWNPYSYGGHPLMATLQPGVFYPPNILFLFLPFDLAFNWIIVVHFFLSGVFTYLLLKERSVSTAGALIAALTFMLSGYLFSVHNVISTLFTVTWTPLAVIFFLRAVKRGSLFYSVLTGIVFSVMFMGGGIEVFYGTAGLLAFLAFVPQTLDLAHPGGTYAPLSKRLLLLLSAAAVFALVSAVQLLPFLELARQSTRSGGLNFFEATTWSFDFKDFIQFFIPDPYGYFITDEKYWSNQSWLKTVYTGAIPFILASFFFLERKKKTLPLLLVSVFALSIAMGRNNLFYIYLYRWLPFFNKIRYPVKYLFVDFLFLSVAAGAGFDCLTKGLREKSKGAKRLIMALLILSTAAALALGVLDYFYNDICAYLARRGIDYPEYNRISINVFNTKRLLFIFIIASILIYGSLKSLKIGKVLPYLTALLLSVDLFFAHSGYYASTPAKDYHKKSLVMEYLQKDPGLFRVFVTPRTMSGNIEVSLDKLAFKEAKLLTLALDKERLAGYNLEHRIFDINGMEVIRRADYTFLYTLMASQKAIDSTNILSMLNVKYVISIPKISSPEFKLRRIIGVVGAAAPALEGEKTLKVYENLNSLPRFFLAGDFRVVKDLNEYVNILFSKKFEPAKVALLDEDPFKGSGAAQASGKEGARKKGAVQLVSYKNNSISLRAECARPSVLVASESFYPGWKVYVDGRPEKLLKADFVLRAVALPPGTHEVRFEYSPASFKAGAFVSTGTILMLFISGVFYYRSKKTGQGDLR